MKSYKLHADGNVIERADGASVPFDPLNRDFVQFVADWQADAVPVQDAQGKLLIHNEDTMASLGLEPEKLSMLSDAVDAMTPALEFG